MCELAKLTAHTRLPRGTLGDITRCIRKQDIVIAYRIARFRVKQRASLSSALTICVVVAKPTRLHALCMCLSSRLLLTRSAVRNASDLGW